MRPAARVLPLLLSLCAAAAPPVLAQDSLPAPRDSAAHTLAPLTVIGRADDLVGVATTASQGHVGKADLRERPITREGELLETVPGVIVTQHSGDGKANQYFVRGFNLDHGTDLAVRLEGMPLNMPSHAHGQGYTDLNFLIPELVEYLDYRMGMYHASLGDFGSAGGAEFHLVRRLDRPFASATGGRFGMERLALGGSRRVSTGDLLLAGEFKRYNGPWIVPQELRKASGVARYSWTHGSSRFSVLGMAYHNRWNASDQIPLRAVRSGLISRFGEIDSSDGGHTQRYSLSGSWQHFGAASAQELQLFAVYTDLSLFSNFGYFLDDSARGDQFNQREHRVVLGANASHRQPVTLLGRSQLLTLGLQTRLDLIDSVGLYHTMDRRRLGAVRADKVSEWGTGVYGELTTPWTGWLRSVAGLRADAYRFSVRGDLPGNAGSRTAAIVSPKLALIGTISPDAEVYLSGGLGFHSNDARGTTITVDPSTGGPAQRVDPLVRSRGAELGLRLSPVPTWRSTLSLWLLGLDSELLFVGDGGTTEPSFASHRAGVTWANYWRASPHLALDVDVSLARARFAGVPGGQDRIPGALENVVAAGITWAPLRDGPYGALRLRHFGAYALIEDNSVRASASSLLNADLGYAFAGIRVQASVLNLLNSRARDIQYYYTSRLPGESAAGVDDIHFHPVEPRQVRLTLGYGL